MEFFLIFSPLLWLPLNHCKVQRLRRSLKTKIMTLQEIQKALKEGNQVLDRSGDDVLYADEKGYLYKNKGNRLFMHCNVVNEEFTIKKPWPQKGDTYYQVIIYNNGSGVEFRRLIWGNDPVEKRWLSEGIVFQTKKEAKTVINNHLDKL